MFNKEGNRGKESESHQLTNSGSPSSHLVIFFENAFLQSQESMLSSPIKDIKILQPAGELGAVRYPLPVQETFSHKEPSTVWAHSLGSLSAGYGRAVTSFSV